MVTNKTLANIMNMKQNQEGQTVNSPQITNKTLRNIIENNKKIAASPRQTAAGIAGLASAGQAIEAAQEPFTALKTLAEKNLREANEDYKQSSSGWGAAAMRAKGGSTAARLQEKAGV
ncbi:MAG: hypothetical protein HP052_00645, partial [Firmicutes bacterium]|nr:hypothetical protein [Bacillota bacterium]